MGKDNKVINEQDLILLSALFDDELTAEELKLIKQRLSELPALAKRWQLYRKVRECLLNNPTSNEGIVGKVLGGLTGD